MTLCPNCQRFVTQTTGKVIGEKVKNQCEDCWKEGEPQPVATFAVIGEKTGGTW